MKSVQGTYHQNPAEIGFLFRFDPFSCHHWGAGPSHVSRLRLTHGIGCTGKLSMSGQGRGHGTPHLITG